MRPIGIVTDSHSSITQKEAAELGGMVLPMPFYFDEECYYEGTTLSREEFFEKLDSGKKVSTSQPAPVEVMKIWDSALEKFEQILYMPISSGLSGSCSAAFVIAQEEKYKGRVHVVDNGRVSTPMHRSILDALELIEEGYTALEIKQILEDEKEKMVIYIGVDTLEYLKQGGESTCFNLGNGNGDSVQHVIEVVKQVTGKEFIVKEEKRRAGDPPVLIGSAEKAEKVLGWKPKYAEIETIVEHAWKWHENKEY